MSNPVAALPELLSQPFGVFGALCIMAAVTAVNSQSITGWLKRRRIPSGLAFNSLYLVGGSSLLINAVVRGELVWLTLQIYMVLVTLKGLVDAKRKVTRFGRSASGEESIDTPGRTVRLTALGADQRSVFPTTANPGDRGQVNSGLPVGGKNRIEA